MRRILLLTTLLSFTGCMVGPNYHRPFVDVPKAYEYEFATAKDTLNLEWWRQFKDPVLEQLIEEALANNNNVKVAAANITNAVGILMQVRSPLFPQFGYSGSYNRLRTSETLASTSFSNIIPGFSIPNPQTTWQAFGNATWQLDIWGRTRRLAEAAEANVYATYEARMGVILSLVASVANSYLQLRGLDEQLAISIKTMKSYGEAVTYFETQFKYGQTSLMTVASAKTQYEIAAAKIPQIQAQIVQTENAINVLLSRNPGHIPRGKSIYDLSLPDVPADIPSCILNRRPDILQAEQNLIAANAQIGAAYALYFPSISLTGALGNASQQLSNLFSGPSSMWSFTGTVTGPIFTAGAIYGQVVQARAQQQAALYTYDQTIQNAFADVENALSSHKYIILEQEAQTRLVAASGQYVYLSELQYKGGYAPYFVVIQAQEQYFPAQLSWVQTRTDLFISMVNIYQAMGGGWVLDAEKLTEDYEELCNTTTLTKDIVYE